MKIYVTSYRVIARVLAAYAVLFAVLGVVVAAIDLPGQAVVWGLYALLVAGFVVSAVRLLAVPRQSWVSVTREAVTWRTPRNPRRAVAASGSVPVASIVSVAVVPTEVVLVKSRPIRAHAVELDLLDGTRAVLPIWSPATGTIPALANLIGALRAACPPQVTINTDLIGS
ncbi:hypothetical protein F4553_001186 [Allocatelliglobosispora scoriae]|uniref:Uncharacterized protein n=1 Tax=Allocatelliglobosispora scoriae TaxID=643052 RepID=A0A841BFE0_9ACTN|nr:hypothetical protein [Allocatelliglobosispora scoriae]MBB5867807.1 hypothetical protein [Allocatelliglobosispora scoriae]